MADSKRKRRQFSTEEKAGILRRHMVDKVAVSDLCNELGRFRCAGLQRSQPSLGVDGFPDFEKMNSAQRRAYDRDRLARNLG